MPRALRFTSDVAPREQRLALFRDGAVDYGVDAIGDPLDFTVEWRLLALNDINIVECSVSPVRYYRSASMIEQDGKDRISILYLTSGAASGTIDGQPIDVAVGDAMIFDLLRTLDVNSQGTTFRIVTLPRHLIEEILPNAHFDGKISASAKLRLAFDQATFLLDHAEEIPEESVSFHVRAIRNLLTMAMLRTYRPIHPDDPAAPLLQRIADVIDQALTTEHDTADVAMILGEPESRILPVLKRFGGLAVLVERRRLLAAYQRLCDPAESALISTIATESGFRNPAAFGRRFRAVFSCTPRDVRTQQRGRLPLWAGAYRVEQNYGPMLA